MHQDRALDAAESDDGDDVVNRPERQGKEVQDERENRAMNFSMILSRILTKKQETDDGSDNVDDPVDS